MPVMRPVPILLDKPRSLLFDHAALYKAEPILTQLWGKDYTFFMALRQLSLSILPEPETGLMNVGAISLNNLAVVLWQGCLHEDPTLTLAQVQAALPVYQPAALFPLVIAALQAWQEQTPAVALDAGPAEVQSDGPLDASTGPSGGPMAA